MRCGQTLSFATVSDEPSMQTPSASRGSDEKNSVWVIEENRTTLGVIRSLLEDDGLHVVAFSTAESCLRLARNREAACAVLIGHPLPDKSSVELLRNLRLMIPGLPCFILTADSRAEPAVQAMKAGAEDYFINPFDPSVVLGAIKSAIARRRPFLPVKVSSTFINGRWKSPAMRAAIKAATQASRTSSPVVITGPHNSGKRAFAKCIHDQSQFSDRSMHVLDLLSIPAAQIEAELFGTPSIQPARNVAGVRGLLCRHPATTLYLENINLLGPHAQQSLVNWLQDQQQCPSPDACRLIVSSASDLPALIATDQFRRDLWYLLTVHHVDVPGLSSRIKDISLLCEDAITRICVRLRLRRPTMTQQALEMLIDHSWPGNLSELQSVMEHAVTHTRDGLVGPDDLPRLESRTIGTQHSSRMIPLGLSSIDEITKASLEAALESCGGNRRRTAQRLKVSLRTVYNMIRRYGLSSTPNPEFTNAPKASKPSGQSKKAAASPPKKPPKS